MKKKLFEIGQGNQRRDIRYLVIFKIEIGQGGEAGQQGDIGYFVFRQVEPVHFGESNKR